MFQQSLLLKLSPPGITADTTSQLRQEFQAYQSLFQAQASGVQQFLGSQAAVIAEAVVQDKPWVKFTLPDAVAYVPISGSSLVVERIPAENRSHALGGLLSRITRADLRSAFRKHISELEQSSNPAISIAAGLLRYAVAFHMTYGMLPAGGSVTYASVDGDDIPNQPVGRDLHQESAVNSSMDRAGNGNEVEKESSEHLVPYVEAARRFYLPQWVAFDDQGHLLTASIREAEGCIASMKNYLSILNSAFVIAPYMIADGIWQQKRYGMLGQLINQGRALAHYQSQEIIQTIQRRVAEHKLDRGLSLSLPYFDDQKLAIENYDFAIIPFGWVMFIPAFAVLAAREQQVKVTEDINLSFTTRKYLLSELQEFERAFTR